MKIRLADMIYFTFLMKTLLLSFNYSLGIFFFYILLSKNLMAQSVSVINLPEKNVLFPVPELYLLLYSIYFEL